MLPDDLMAGSPRPTKDLVQHFESTGKSCITVARVLKENLNRYGIISPVSNVSGNATQIAGIVEKPSPKEAPSDLAAIGRYAFNPEIFEQLRIQTAGVDGEIQLTDSINALAEMGKVDALQLFGRRYDCGSKFGYLEAIVDHALEHPDFGSVLRI